MFDFKQLQREIIVASLEAIKEMQALHPDEKIIAFALYSDDGAMTVSHAINTEQHLHQCKEDDPEYWLDYKFAPAEWKCEAAFCKDVFDEISHKVSEAAGKPNTNFSTFKKQLFQTCFDALQEIKKHFNDEILWLFAVSDSEITQEQIDWLYSLNGNDTGKEFEEWAISFG